MKKYDYKAAYDAFKSAENILLHPKEQLAHAPWLVESKITEPVALTERLPLSATWMEDKSNVLMSDTERQVDKPLERLSLYPESERLSNNYFPTYAYLPSVDSQSCLVVNHSLTLDAKDAATYKSILIEKGGNLTLTNGTFSLEKIVNKGELIVDNVKLNVNDFSQKSASKIRTTQSTIHAAHVFLNGIIEPLSKVKAANLTITSKNEITTGEKANIALSNLSMSASEVDNYGRVEVDGLLQCRTNKLYNANEMMSSVGDYKVNHFTLNTGNWRAKRQMTLNTAGICNLSRIQAPSLNLNALAGITGLLQHYHGSITALRAIGISLPTLPNALSDITDRITLVDCARIFASILLPSINSIIYFPTLASQMLASIGRIRDNLYQFYQRVSDGTAGTADIISVLSDTSDFLTNFKPISENIESLTKQSRSDLANSLIQETMQLPERLLHASLGEINSRGKNLLRNAYHFYGPTLLTKSLYATQASVGFNRTAYASYQDDYLSLNPATNLYVSQQYRNLGYFAGDAATLRAPKMDNTNGFFSLKYATIDTLSDGGLLGQWTVDHLKTRVDGFNDMRGLIAGTQYPNLQPKKSLTVVLNDNYHVSDEFNKRFNTETEIDLGLIASNIDIDHPIQSNRFIHFDATNKLSIHKNISAKKGMFLSGYNGVDVDAHTTQTHHWTTGGGRTWYGRKKPKAEHHEVRIINGAFTAEEGSIFFQAKNAGVHVTATDLNARYGIKQRSRYEGTITSLKGTSSVRRSSGDLFGSRSSYQYSDNVNLVSIASESPFGQSYFVSDEAGLMFNGFLFDIQGDLKFKAKDNIVFNDIILSHEVSKKSRGVFVSQPVVDAIQNNQPLNLVPLASSLKQIGKSGDGLATAINLANTSLAAANLFKNGLNLQQYASVRVGYGKRYSKMRYTTLAGSHINVGGRLSIESDSAIQFNNAPLVVANQVKLQAPLVKQCGAELPFSMQSKQSSVFVDIGIDGSMNAGASYQQSKAKGVSAVNQHIITNQLLIDVDTLLQQGGNIDCQSVQGRIGLLDSQVLYNRFSAQSMGGRVSTGGDISVNYANTRSVSKGESSGIHVHNANDANSNLRINQANLRGSYLAYDGLNPFEVSHVETEAVHDAYKQSAVGIGLNLLNPAITHVSYAKHDKHIEHHTQPLGYPKQSITKDTSFDARWDVPISLYHKPINAELTSQVASQVKSSESKSIKAISQSNTKFDGNGKKLKAVIIPNDNPIRINQSATLFSTNESRKQDKPIVQKKFSKQTRDAMTVDGYLKKTAAGKKASHRITLDRNNKLSLRNHKGQYSRFNWQQQQSKLSKGVSVHVDLLPPIVQTYESSNLLYRENKAGNTSIGLGNTQHYFVFSPDSIHLGASVTGVKLRHENDYLKTELNLLDAGVNGRLDRSGISVGMSADMINLRLQTQPLCHPIPLYNSREACVTANAGLHYGMDVGIQVGFQKNKTNPKSHLGLDAHINMGLQANAGVRFFTRAREMEMDVKEEIPRSSMLVN